MIYYVTKLAITTVLVVLISEIARRSTLIGGILASVPVVSVLALIWLYVETGDVARVSALATSVFWLVLPSLVLFLVLPRLLAAGVGFFPGLACAIAATALCYWATVALLTRFGGGG